MSVDPALRGVVTAFAEDNVFDLAGAREHLAAFAHAVGAGTQVEQVTDGELAGVPVRTYRPAGSPRTPPLLWCHGGGWVAGSVSAVDPLCRALAARTRAPLISVGYRLAPENPFPAGLEDCIAVLRTVADDGPVAIGGDSAGGGLAAAACLAVVGEDLPVVGQVLINPLLDATLCSPSVSQLASGFGLTRRALEHFVHLYLDRADPTDPRCSPLLAPDLHGLPAAVVVTAELDPLRDEGEAYAALLRAAGVPVRARLWDAMVHGFVGMSALTPVADDALDWTVAALAELTRD